MTDASIRSLARTAGLLYVVLLVCGMFSPIVLDSLVVPGAAATTADNVLGSLGLFRISLVSWLVIVVADVALSVVLYLLLEPVSRAWSMVSAAFRLVYSTVLAAFLLVLFRGFVLLTGSEGSAAAEGSDAQVSALAHFEAFGDGFVLALMLFGIHLIVFGTLLKRSGYVPGALAVLLAVAGIGYLLDGLAAFFLSSHSDTMTAVFLTPALLGEVGLTGWLLIKGVTIPDRNGVVSAG